MLKIGFGAAIARHGRSHNRGLATAVGAGMMASGFSDLMSSKTHSNSHRKKRNTYHHVETEIEKQARLAREAAEQQARLEEEQKKVEEQRRYDELRYLEEQRRHEQENIAEAKRETIFDEHVAFINEANELKPDDFISRVTALQCLKTPIYRFHDSKKQGLPDNPDDKNGNLFWIILSRDLPKDVQVKLLNLLFDRGYSYINLFREPLVNAFLSQNESFDKIILQCYLNNPTLLCKEVEERIWERFAKSKEQKHAEQIFNYLLSKREISVVIQFASLWLMSLTIHQDVIAISKLFKDSKLELYSSYLDKVAEQRVLTLELEKPAVPKEKVGNTVKKDPVITDFLSSHRSALCCWCSKTAGQKIYDKIVNKKNDEAKRELAAEQFKINQEFKQKLRT